MGKWSYSAFGNDTARDLLLEYQVAFHQYDPKRAVEILDHYVNTLFVSQDEEIVNYYISLAVYIHKNGISEKVAIPRAIKQIERMLKDCHDDKRAISQLISQKESLQAPLPKQKAIKLNINSKPVYQIGDIITLKIFPDSDDSTFRYIIIKKEGDYISWSSKICPEIKDYWPVFQLTDYCDSQKPGIKDYQASQKNLYTFYSNGKSSSYKKRNAELLGNEEVRSPISKCTRYLFFSTNVDQKIHNIIFPTY